jgi:Carboxypeptidase regulatory-like domain
MMKKQRHGEGEPGTFVLKKAFYVLQPGLAASRRLASLGAIMLALATLWLVFTPVQVAAKKKPPTTKTVRGQVLDPSNNGIVGAAVEMTDLATGKKTAIYTQTGGNFLFTDLKPTEDYEFRATYNGQSSESRKVSSWDTRLQMVINLHIPPPKDE